MERVVKGIWIPIEIWETENLSMSEKVMLMEIDSFTKGKKGCYAGNEHFMKLLGLKKRWVQTCLSSLEKKGYIRIERDGENRSLVSLLATPERGAEKCTGGCSGMHGGMQKNAWGDAEKCTHINTYTSTDTNTSIPSKERYKEKSPLSGEDPGNAPLNNPGEEEERKKGCAQRKREEEGRKRMPWDPEPEEDEEEGMDTPENGTLDFQKVVDLYHGICRSYPKVLRLSDARKAHIRVRFLTDMKGDWDTLKKVFTKMEASSFLKGDNRNGWKATFDWIFDSPNNWLKVLEGNYDNREAQTGTGNGVPDKNPNRYWDD